MSGTNKKQFGVWMDNHNAIVVGKESAASDEFVVLGRVNLGDYESNSNENAANNAKKGCFKKLCKEITSYMQNVDEVHVTGSGTAQEQFISYLAQTPQYKNTVAKESTSTKMSEDKLIEFISSKFNS